MSEIGFATELKSVARRIEELLNADSFPDGLLPPMLAEAVVDYPRRRGKRLRPALVLWTCGLLGGRMESAESAALAVEIYHNWTLVHDDIIDNDRLRRGEPSAHFGLAYKAEKEFSIPSSAAEKFGMDLAILAGDLQQAWAVETMASSVERGVSAELSLNLCRRMQKFVGRRLISGEALDVEFTHRPLTGIVVDEIEAMLAMKTSALLSFCAEAGAAIALKDAKIADPRIARLAEFARVAGIAFQLQDDWLGVFGETDTLGKPVCADFAESKPTMLLKEAVARLEPREKNKILGLMGLPRYGEKEVSVIRSLLTESGAAAAVLNQASRKTAKASAILTEFPDNKYRQLLQQWLEYLTKRNK